MSNSPQKIFGLGLSRTGTTQLSWILKQLGFDVAHYTEVLFPFDIYGKPRLPNWSLLESRDAFTDSPVPLLYPELDRRCEGAKFILTTRNVDDWLASMRWMLTHGRVIWEYVPGVDQYHRLLYGTHRFNRKKMLAAWEDYHTGIREYFIKRDEDLLIIHLDNGFDVNRICHFLNMEPRAVDLNQNKNCRRRASLRERLHYFQYRVMLHFRRHKG